MTMGLMVEGVYEDEGGHDRTLGTGIDTYIL